MFKSSESLIDLGILLYTIRAIAKTLFLKSAVLQIIKHNWSRRRSRLTCSKCLGLDRTKIAVS